MLNFISKVLRNLADQIDAGNSHLSQEDTLKIVSILDIMQNGDCQLSKLESYTYLGISRATFDNLVHSGYIPEGKHCHEGVKSLFWNKSDLEIYKLKYISK